MFIVLTGAQKNVSDFLIRDRGLSIIRYIRPKEKIVELNSWEPVDQHLSTINRSKGLIICGGPGYSPTLYPDAYPLTNNLERIKVPIYFLGCSWFGQSADELTLKNYHFSPEARLLLDKAYRFGGLSTCESISKAVLENNGYSNVTVTGCPAMYNLPYLGKEFIPPSSINKIVFTTPLSIKYVQQAIEIMNYLRNQFPRAELNCVFHQGIEPDRYTTKTESRWLKLMRDTALDNGCIVHDAAYSLDKTSFYSNCDLHIGYRVHAHIYFLSERKPSFLLHEDGRGSGITTLFGLAGIDAYDSTRLKVVRKGADKEPVLAEVSVHTAKDPASFVDSLHVLIQESLNNNFSSFHQIPKVIDLHFNNMKKFVSAM